jgi:hypothetical protein
LRLRDAGIEIARFDPDLMSQIEELNRDFARLHARGLQRTELQTADPADPEEVGPNGHRVGYTEAGDKVEWVPNDEDPDDVWPLLLRRNDALILDTYNELWDKVWWNRHQSWAYRIESGEEKLTESREELFERAQQAAARIEAKYGRENLGWDDFRVGPSQRPAFGPLLGTRIRVERVARYLASAAVMRPPRAWPNRRNALLRRTARLRRNWAHRLLPADASTARVATGHHGHV